MNKAAIILIAGLFIAAGALWFAPFPERNTGTPDEGALTDENFNERMQDALGAMNLYQGNFHSHTANSDGTGTPEEAFTWARDGAKFDFYFMTDHAEYLTPISWSDEGTQADAFNNDGQFVAVRGFEWSHPYYGHVCVYNTDMYTNAILTPVLELFYLWVDTNNAITQFNHPSREPGIFNNLAYSESVADNFCMIETGNKDDGNVGNDYYPYYIVALDNGWKVSPSSNQDNHELKNNTHRTIVMAPELTRSGIFDAVKARRTYSTDDANMQIVFKCGDAWMGSSVNSGKKELTVLISDDENISKIELVTNGGNMVQELNFGNSTDSRQVAWSPEIDAKSGEYYFLRITENDENKDEAHGIQIAVTAPIWIN
jgi:hypothetical protein